MKIFKNISVVQQEVDKVYCNMCGSEIQRDSLGVFYDYLDVEKDWGYLSRFDGQTHTFDLCSECYEKLIKSFKLPIE